LQGTNFYQDQDLKRDMSEKHQLKKQKTNNKKIEEAISKLSSLEEKKRVAAVKTLSGTNDPRVIHSLQKVAKGDQSLQIRFLAKEGLQQIRTCLTQKIGIDFTDNSDSTDANVKPINLKKLTDALKAKSASDRNNAVKASMAYLNPQALKVIIPHLKKEREVKVKRNCIMAIGVLGNKDHIPLLLHYLEHKEIHYRLKAIAALANLGEISSYPRLVNSMSDNDKTVRRTALTAVLKLGKPKVLRLFHKMLLSKHKWMKIAATKACGKLKSTKVLKIITIALNDKEEEVKKAARASLRRLNKTGLKGAGKLLEAYKKAGGKVTLDNFSIPSEIDSLSSMLNDESPENRLAEIQRMVEEKDTSLIEMAIVRLDVEKDEHVLCSLIIAIGQLTGEESIDRISKFLKSDNPRIIASTVEALSFIDSPSIVPLLIPFLKSKDNRICANAIVALKEAPDADFISSLKNLALNSERNHQLSAIYAILEIQTKEAIDILQLMKDSPDKEICERIKKAEEILSDKTFTSKNKIKKSVEQEIPKELTINSPEDDVSTTDTRSQKIVSERDLGETNSGKESSDKQEVENPTPTDEMNEKDISTSEKKKKDKNQPGFRTQIDQMFNEAEKIKPEKKPTKAVKPTNKPKGNGKPTESILDKIRQLFQPAPKTTKADGTPSPSNIIVIMVAVVVVFLIIYTIGGGFGGGESYDDDFYTNNDF